MLVEGFEPPVPKALVYSELSDQLLNTSVATPTGFEPATFRSTGGCSDQLSYRALVYHWLAWTGSNCRPLVYQTSALTKTELHAIVVLVPTGRIELPT